MPGEYARPPAHRIRENKEADARRAARIDDIRGAAYDAKCTVLRAVLADFADTRNAMVDTGEDVVLPGLDVASDLVRDRLRRLEGSDAG